MTGAGSANLQTFLRARKRSNPTTVIISSTSTNPTRLGESSSSGHVARTKRGRGRGIDFFVPTERVQHVLSRFHTNRIYRWPTVDSTRSLASPYQQGTKGVSLHVLLDLFAWAVMRRERAPLEGAMTKPQKNESQCGRKEKTGPPRQE